MAYCYLVKFNKLVLTTSTYMFDVVSRVIDMKHIIHFSIAYHNGVITHTTIYRNFLTFNNKSTTKNFFKSIVQKIHVSYSHKFEKVFFNYFTSWTIIINIIYKY